MTKKLTKKQVQLAKKVEKILTLRKAGLSVAKIGKRVGLSESGVFYHLNK